MTHTTATTNVYCIFIFCGWKVQRPSSRWLARVRKQAGHKAERYCVTKWSRCVERLAWLCLHWFLRASLLCAATCELAGKCKQSAKEWSATKWSGMSELSVCYIFERWHLWNQEKCSERKRYEVRLKRTAFYRPFLFFMLDWLYEDWTCSTLCNWPGKS